MACGGEANPDDYLGDGGNNHGHNHDHNHGHGSHGHSHDQSDKAGADAGDSLLPYIDTEHMSCLNERVANSCRKIFKPYHVRLQFSEETKLSSDVDEQLILQIPFTDLVRIRSFQVVCEDPDLAPAHVKLFKDQSSIDFDSVDDVQCTQEFDLTADTAGDFSYNVKVHKFQATGHLTMFFDTSFDDSEEVEIDYIAIYGDYLYEKSKAVEAVYELRPLASDSRNRLGEDNKNSFIQ